MEPIENLYFNWLCAKVIDITSSVYKDLLDLLHRTEFIWVVAADSHRASDGIELRTFFLRETQIEGDPNWLGQPASILEVLISFAYRAEFQTDIPVPDWFFEFLDNLGLKEFRHISDSDLPKIEKILYTFLWRRYNRKGFGGLFPINNTPNDQRKKEIWAQFCEYVMDKGLF